MGAHKYDAKDDDDDDLSVCYIIKHLRVFPQFEREREQEQNEIHNERHTWIYKNYHIFDINTMCLSVYLVTEL